MRHIGHDSFNCADIRCRCRHRWEGGGGKGGLMTCPLQRWAASTYEAVALPLGGDTKLCSDRAWVHGCVGKITDWCSACSRVMIRWHIHSYRIIHANSPCNHSESVVLHCSVFTRFQGRTLMFQELYVSSAEVETLIAQRGGQGRKGGRRVHYAPTELIGTLI